MSGEPAPAACVHRDGEALVFAGTLRRAQVAALWRQAQGQLSGVTRFELGAVDAVDSAGLALLAELAARAPGSMLHGDPAGLAELREAYRVGPALAFAS